jgi:type II secretory pathway component PulM
VERATSEDWSRYYEGARRKRRVMGGDPIERYVARRNARERRFFIGTSLVLVAVLIVFYSVLVQ